MRLLVVEDEPAAASVLANGLREHAYVVDVADDGRAALERALVYDYDLIVLDVMLPVVDGREVCRRLRARGVAVPILMLTALGEIDARVAGLDAGADDYLPKPYHFHELLARVRALLRRGPAFTPSEMRIADLSIDSRTRRVERGGRIIPLTTKEYTLLAYLAHRAGDVVSRADISDHVWDENFDPMSNVIDVYVQRLRRKVDDGHERKLIHTIRGAGYVLSSSDGKR
jgi:two-component system, OmpR family, copper resistance phosphate regulon response regulator CusR